MSNSINNNFIHRISIIEVMTLRSKILNEEFHDIGLYCSTNIATIVALISLQPAGGQQNHLAGNSCVI
jgi:hypothetical protein